MQPKSWEERGIRLKLTPWVGRDVIFLTTVDKLDPAPGPRLTAGEIGGRVIPVWQEQIAAP